MHINITTILQNGAMFRLDTGHKHFGIFLSRSVLQVRHEGLAGIHPVLGIFSACLHITLGIRSSFGVLTAVCKTQPPNCFLQMVGSVYC